MIKENILADARGIKTPMRWNILNFAPSEGESMHKESGYRGKKK